MASASEMIDVPADGLCFYHCLGHALQHRSSNSIRAEICDTLAQMGLEEEAIRLRKEGSDGYPDELAFVAALDYYQDDWRCDRLKGRCSPMGTVHVAFELCRP